MPTRAASEQDPPGAKTALAFLQDDRGPILAPVRAVLFGRDRFHEHGLSLARAQEVGRPGRVGRFYPRLDQNLHTLHRARTYLDQLDRRGEALSPAAEWLLDNFHLIEAQLPEIRAALPRRYYADLPKLTHEPLEGLPRIYGIAWAFVAHTDSSFDAQLLESFIAGYQSVNELTLGELWALPTTLRVVLLENLARLADMVATNKAARELANACGESARGLEIETLDAHLRQSGDRGVDGAFLSQLEQRLRSGGASIGPELSAWLTARVPDANAALLSAQELQAANNVSVGHAVMALRAIENYDWERFVNGSSSVIGVLRASTAFVASGELTRDQCSHAVERLARQLRRSEREVASHAVSLCEGDAALRRLGPAHLLIGGGRPLLLASLGVRNAGSPWRKGVPRNVREFAYLAVIAAATATLIGVLMPGAETGWARFATALLLLVPASEFVIATLNRALAESVPVTRLPRLDMRSGVPPEHRTLVVVPCLLSSEATIRELVLTLEQHHLAAKEHEVQYGLLSDWSDAPEARQPNDDALLEAGVRAIAELNSRHPRSGEPRFLLLHRERAWSDTERRWMGHERKRGKIETLIAHIAVDAPSPFIDLGDCSRIATGVRYVVTLDSDTQMPPGALCEMVAIAAHPMNRPQVDAGTGRVVSGFGILQPRIATPIAEPQYTTYFSRIFSGPAGIDVYNAGSSDVYQDAFGEGSFTGKGLIDVQAFYESLAGRVREGRLLSHDLYEGICARCALLSDVSLLEEQPVHPDVAASREHRWTRGDWQLLPFIGGLLKSRVGALNLWKLIDNLRRSLLAPASVALLWWSFATPWLAPHVAVLLVLAAWTIGPLMSALAGLAPSRDDIALRHFMRHAGLDMANAVLGSAWRMATLLQGAAIQIDAIVRALWRMAVSHRLLLQWTTAAQAQATARSDAAGLWRRHIGASAAAVVWAAAGLAMSDAHAAWLIGFGLLWLLTPLWLWLGSQPVARQTLPAVDADQRDFLHLVAQQTWRFFDRHVGADDNHLPPDNLQLEPAPMLAHRTSPTNIGLYLLSVASAQRFGYIGHVEMIERLVATLDTVQKLDKHRGHLLNWIDTQSLRVLEPAYVSTVDSGNFAAALWAVAEACRELAELRGGKSATSAAIALNRAAQRLENDSSPTIVALRQEPALRELLDALLRPADAKRDAGGESADEVAAMRRRWQAAQARWATLAVDANGLLDPLLDLLRVLGSHLRDAEAGPEATAAQRPALVDLARRLDGLAQAMEFDFLYDPQRRLFHIGYRVAEQTLDVSYYDMLASESRLTSFIAIAKGDVPRRHWQALGRPFLSVGGRPTLRSWSGSMFEYLMPALLMNEPHGGLLQTIDLGAVRAQQRFGEQQNLPWGVSESAYFAQDHTLAFQYSPFGVPDLALRRTPIEDRVIAPYATVLAAMIDPAAAVANLRRLQTLGARGGYGFIEALDATESRLTERASPQRVATVMAHHQGMSLVALCNLLCEQSPRRWFGEAPLMKSHAALLQERLPREIVFQRPAALARPERDAGDAMLPAVREIDVSRSDARPTQLLGNGSYSVSLRPNGAGASNWRGRAVTRSRDDALRDAYGHRLLIRTGDEPEFHSLTEQPAPRPQTQYLTRYFSDHVEFEASCAQWQSQVDVFVSPDDDVEFRQLSLHNRLARPLTIELISSFEAVLAPQRADEAHPAFSNLFIRAQAFDERCIALERRPRLAGEAGMWAAHFIATSDTPADEVGLCADRAGLLPRNGRAVDAHRPDGAPVVPGQPLDTGLDPIACVTVRLTIPPNGKLNLTFATAAAEDLAGLAGIVDEYRQLVHVNRARMMAATLARIRYRELGVEASDLHEIQDLGGVVLSSWRRTAVTELLGFDKRMLWRFGISGDLPLILLRINSVPGLGLVQSVLTAQRLWQIAGVGCDVVVLNGEPASYLMPIQRDLMSLRDRATSPLPGNQPGQRGGVHLLQLPGMTPPELTALAACARVNLLADGRALSRHVQEVLGPTPEAHSVPAGSEPPQSRRSRVDAKRMATSRFDRDGRDFVIHIDEALATPRPWVNVIANERFGTIVSESGAGYTWAGNSRMNGLTDWSNDPLLDPAAEHFLVEDRANGGVFGVLPGWDRNGTAGYRVTHTQGLSSFVHERNGLRIEARVSVHATDRLKYVQVSISNSAAGGAKPRSLRLLGMVEWIFGQQRQDRMSLATSYAPSASAVLARQREHAGGFGDGVGFLTLVGVAVRQWTCDRSEFFDARGKLQLPRKLAAAHGAGLDPCAAIDAIVEVPATGRLRFAWVIGHADNEQDALTLAKRVQAEGAEPAAALDAQREWKERLGAVTVRTPDPAFDALVNHWLLYQTLGCRIWAKAGFYQAGGATGFRDQLQDSMALVHTEPQRLRDQILLHASRQFPEGDVQHWWHAPTGAGVRTHFSDDLLWLPLAVLRYLGVTSDRSLLDVNVPYLEGAEVPEGAEDAYYVPAVSPLADSLYEHCARAIDRGLRFGAHGLPLMGSGDWNDGMNRVGHEGHGESVWLGWFLMTLLPGFSELAAQRVDTLREHRWQRAHADLAEAMHRHGWDGDWYRRAYFDNGEPLGSHLNDECQIDLIAQAWSVFARRPGEPLDDERARHAMASADRRLVDRRVGVVRLLDPPLANAVNNAGYIQAYPPGVRENGGQYTHAGVWAVMAYAQLGQADLAWECFRMLSPAHRAADTAGQRRYRIEPYVMAGDTYSEAPYEAWGGWSWYTGSAAWMYRAAVESLLGLTIEGSRLRVAPCLPPHWPEASLSVRVGTRRVELVLRREPGAPIAATPLRAGEWLETNALPDESRWLVLVDAAPRADVPGDALNPAKPVDLARGA